MTTFNFSGRRFNEQQKEAYIAGYEAKNQEVESIGWIAARDKFNIDNPADIRPSLNGYAYACGEIDCLLVSM